MVSSAKLALYALLQGIQSSGLGRNLKAFILRCLLLWPRILRLLRKVWSWYFQTNRGEKSTKGASDVIVCASRAFGRVPVGEASGHSMSGSNDVEQSIPMEDVIQRTPSVPHSLSSRGPSPHGSLRLSATPFPPGSVHSLASSLPSENEVGAMEWIMRRSNTPVNWTHSRDAGRQFTGVSSRGHSRPSSPSLFRRHSSRPNTPTRADIDIATRLAMIQRSQDSPEGSPSKIPIEVKEPSRPGTPEDTRSVYSFHPPQLPSAMVHGETQSPPTHPRFPSPELVNPSAVSLHSRGQSPSGTHTGSHQSRESIRPEGPMASQSTQVPPRPPFPFPEPSIPRISTRASTVNVRNSPFRPGTPPVKPMHSGQVSRYVKNGDV